MEGKTSSLTINDHFISTPFIENIAARAVKYVSSGFPVHLTGPTGIGKTALAMHIAQKINRPAIFIHGHPDLSTADLIGRTSGFTHKKVVDNYIHSVLKETEHLKENWVDGYLLKAAKEGYTVIYDEFTRTKAETNNILLPVLEEKRLPLYGVKEEGSFLPLHPHFSMILTSNPDDYIGVYHMQDALMDRLVTIPLQQINSETETWIISQKSGVSDKEAQAVSHIVSKMRSYCKESHGPSLRASLIIASIAKKTMIPIDSSNEEFQQLCTDVLWYSYKKNRPDASKNDLKALIVDKGN